jgi:hypothetical protein
MPKKLLANTAGVGLSHGNMGKSDARHRPAPARKRL